MAEARFRYLDGIRGIACLIVALCHFIIAFHSSMVNGVAAQSHFAGDTWVSHTSLVFFFSPSLGVDFFFVLSGFVLATSVAQSPPAWLALAIRRWVRLCFPILAIAWLIWLAFHAGAFNNVAATAVITKAGWLQSMYVPLYNGITPLWLARNALFTFFTAKTGYIEALDPVLWTIPIELLGSLAIYAAYCLAGPLLRRRGLGLGAAIIIAILTWGGNYSGLACGVTLFEIRRTLLAMPPRPHLAASLGWAAVAAGLWLASTPFAVQGAHLHFINFCSRHGLAVGIIDMQRTGATLLVAATLTLRPLQRLLSTRPFTFMGQISYMLYLVQIPVLCSFGVTIFLATRRLGYNEASLCALAVYLPTAILLATVATKFIDRPFIWLSRRVGKEAVLFLQKKNQKNFY